MRASGAVILVIGILALAFAGLSYQAQAVQGPAVDNGTNSSAMAYNLTGDVLAVSGQTLTTALVIGGIALVSIIGIGILVSYGPRGR